HLLYRCPRHSAILHRAFLEATSWGGQTPDIEGSIDGHTATAIPSAMSPLPASFVSPIPCRQFFSARKTSARTAIHTRFIKPTTTRTAISAQQHPRQYAPFVTPARNALRAPP